MTEISCILPVYNGENYLKSAIDSVLAQTFQDFELIIVDDGSTDSSPEILKSYKDKRIKIITNKKNLNLPKSLNIGFSHATGYAWTWTSHDNLYHESAFETYLDYLNGFDIVYSDWTVIDSSDNIIKTVSAAPISQIDTCNVVHASFMFLPQVWKNLGGYDESAFLAEDWDFWIRAFFSGMSFRRIPKCLYSYRVHDKMLCTSRWFECQLAYAKVSQNYFGTIKAAKQLGKAVIDRVIL